MSTCSLTENIYVGQSYFDIRLDTKMDLTGASDFKILYFKKDGTEGAWNAQRDGTEVVYEVQPGDIDQAGPMVLQAYAVKDGRAIKGAEVHIHIDQGIKNPS
jgi:hypothetical protein